MSYGKGGVEPLVTIIEFSEFQCPFCSRVLPTMKKVHETYGADVRVVFKHNPLSFHKDAKPASKAALAAGEQGKFWEMHDLLFANQRKLKMENLEAYATQLGLDMAKFKADMADAKFDKVIAADQALGARFGARGTPNFFINGRNLRGAQPFDNFKKIIDEEIAKAKALIAKGTPRAGVYAALTAKGQTKAAAPAPRKREDDNKVYKVEIKPGDAIKGNPNAPVTIAEFSDFQCPFCSRVNPTIKKIFETYGDKVRVVFKHNPLAFHKDAPLASEAALAAGAQGKFWEMHDALFANQRQLKRPDLEKYAAQIGLNLEQFNADLDSHKFKAQVDADLAQAKSIGVRGTPNFFINGKKLTGAQPFERFKEKIDEALKTKKLPTNKPNLPIVKPTAEQLKQVQKELKPLVKPGTPLRPEAIKKIKPIAERAVKNKQIEALKKIAANNADKGSAIEIPVGASAAKGGGENALVTIVEFSDFQCPFCKRVTGSLKQIHETYGDKVRVVFKHNPLPFHKDAPLASQATWAAQQQGKFWEMHDKIFENIRAIKRADLEKHAQALGLDMVKFKADIDSDAAKAQVKADQALAQKVAARGTPHFFVNGTRLPGALPFDRFKSAIDAEIKAVEGLLASGKVKTAAEAYKLRVAKNYAAPAPRKSRGAAANDKIVYNI
jgi:protein-disulfide isomerase